MNYFKRNFCWIGQRAVDCAGLHKFLHFDAIICCDYGSETEIIQREYNIKVYSLEQVLGTRKVWSNFTIDEAVRHFESYFSGKEVTILPYKISEYIETISKKSSGKIDIISPPSNVVNLLDDKIYCSRMFAQIGVAHPKWSVFNTDDLSFQSIKSIYGTKFVLKKRRGASGHQTYIVASEKEFSGAVKHFNKEDILVTEFVEGLSYNVHVVIDFMGKIHVSSPSAQLVGIPELTNKKEIYCGNDFSIIRNLPPVLTNKINEQAIKIGNWLFREFEYVGIFGIDLIGNSDEIMVLEINPRFQGSTSLLTQSEIFNGMRPTVMSMFKFNASKLENRKNPLFLTGSQLILHLISETGIEFSEDLLSGVYAYIDHKLTYLRPGVTLLDCLNKDEFVLTCGMPRQGIRIQPGSSLIKIITPNSALDPKTGFLNARMSDLAEITSNFLRSKAINIKLKGDQNGKN